LRSLKSSIYDSMLDGAFKRSGGAAHFTKGLALTDSHRRELMAIKTTRQLANLRVLKQSPEMHVDENKSADPCPQSALAVLLPMSLHPHSVTQSSTATETPPTLTVG
jgi:hypothetical protein